MTSSCEPAPSSSVGLTPTTIDVWHDEALTWYHCQFIPLFTLRSPFLVLTYIKAERSVWGGRRSSWAGFSPEGHRVAIGSTIAVVPGFQNKSRSLMGNLGAEMKAAIVDFGSIWSALTLLFFDLDCTPFPHVH